MYDNIGVIANVVGRQMGTTDLWLLTHEDLRKGSRISAVLDFLTPALAESLEAGAKAPIRKRAGSAVDAIELPDRRPRSQSRVYPDAQITGSAFLSTT